MSAYPRRVDIKAPAKVNLYLEVLGERPDGYHDLESVFQAISLYDNLSVTLLPGDGVNLTCNVKSLETPSNLASRAATAFLTAAGKRGAVSIGLEKNIPMEAGLGGGSSDAAAVLVALNELYDGPFSDDELRSIGATLGSDVPFFIDGGTALVEGRGERVRPAEMRGKYYFLVFYPGFGVSTASVYKNLRLNLTQKRDCAKLLLAELSQGNLEVARKYFFNRLEETAFAVEGRLVAARDAMQGCLSGAQVILSGSGASLFSAYSVLEIALESYKALKEISAGGVLFAESIRGRRNAANPKGDSRGH